MPTSACEAPPIILGTKVLWPGASRMVYLLLSVSKKPLPTSTVLPFALSSLVKSNAHERYHVSRPASLASFLYFSIVRSSTIPVAYSIDPPRVDFPASTWPMKIRLTCSLPYTSCKVSSSTSAVCSFITASASLVTPFFSPGIGEDFPVDEDGEILPDEEVAFSLVCSTAFAAATFGASSEVEFSFEVGESDLFGAVAGADGTPIERTLVFGGIAVEPDERTFAFGAAAGSESDCGVEVACSVGAPVLCLVESTIGLLAILTGAWPRCCWD